MFDNGPRWDIEKTAVAWFARRITTRALIAARTAEVHDVRATALRATPYAWRAYAPGRVAVNPEGSRGGCGPSRLNKERARPCRSEDFSSATSTRANHPQQTGTTFAAR